MAPLLATLGVLAVSTGAAAAEPASGKDKSPYVDLQTIGFPAVVRGRLVNYIFVQVRLHVAGGVDASKIQQGEPFLRDTLVHASGRTPFNPPGDGVRLDDARVRAEVIRAANAQFGPGKVTGVELLSETPQKRVGVPGAATLRASAPPPD